MLAMICAYLCIPVRYRFIARWLAAGFFLFIVVVVLILFFRVLSTVPRHHGWLQTPEQHYPWSPDAICYPIATAHHFKEGK